MTNRISLSPDEHHRYLQDVALRRRRRGDRHELRLSAQSRALQVLLQPLPELIQQPLQFLRLLHKDLYAGIAPGGCLGRRGVLLAQTMLGNSLAHDLTPRFALLAKQLCQLVLDMPSRPGALVTERGVELNGCCTRPGELERIRARRDAPTADEGD